MVPQIIWLCLTFAGILMYVKKMEPKVYEGFGAVFANFILIPLYWCGGFFDGLNNGQFLPQTILMILVTYNIF